MPRKTERIIALYSRIASTIVLSTCLGILVEAKAAAEQNENAMARRILETTGVEGGLVVHVGCGDGKLTAALLANDSYLVQGLDTISANVEKARSYIHSLGLDGDVSVDLWRGTRLPYTNNLVNLLVAEDLGKVAVEEAMRVLAPNGVAYIKKKGKWTKTVKPWPKDIDEWTHFLHDAGGNAVAKDALVGPPRRVQWMSGPLWLRNHHTLASVSAVVTARGRIFYIVDEGPSASMAVPARWFLIAREAFNGVLLWKKAISSWGWYRRGFRSGPVQLPRTLVASGNRVYCPLGLDAPVTALDAATGETVMSYKDTVHTEEVVLEGDTLFVVTGSPVAEQSVRSARRRRGGKRVKNAQFVNEKTVKAFRSDTGETLWRWPTSGASRLMPLTLTAAGGRVFFQVGNGVVCLDKETGKEMWRYGKAEASKSKQRRQPGWSVATLVAHDDVLLWADGKVLSALSAETGKALWDCACKPGFKSPTDVFVIGGLVWLGPEFSTGRDLHTGQVKKKNDIAQRIWTAGHHHRCYREKATERYIITGKRGIEFLDLVADNHSRNNWIRGLCQYGVMPANGLIYAPPHACGCYMESKLYGFWALAASREPNVESSGSGASRLERCAAYGQIRNPKSEIRNRDDWPTYRRDSMRSGSTTSEVPAQLRNVWQAEVGGRLSAPVAAEGNVIVSSIDSHRVVALDARSGEIRWTFTAGGRVDSPPTIYRGLTLFGCADGWVYCLRASDGEKVWRFRAAPEDRRTVALDRIESVWPVHGSVLVEDGVAYAAAGRSSYLDGGIYLYGLNPETGEIVCQTLLRSAHPGADKTPAAEKIAPKKIAQNTVDGKTFSAPDKSDSFSMAGGATTDVLVSDGASLYLRQVRFDQKLVRQENGGRHIFSTSRLLDGSENHRSHWVFGVGDFSRIPVAYSWIANSNKNRWGVRLAVPYGLLLAFDAKTVWGVRRRGGYALFAEGNKPFSLGEAPLPDFRAAGKETSTSTWKWSVKLSMRPRAMLRAGGLLFLGGMPEASGQKDPAAFEGRKGGLLWAASAVDGRKLSQRKLESPPVWDGMAAAGGRLYMSMADGKVLCLGGL